MLVRFTKLCSVMLGRYHETVFCDVGQISLDCNPWCWSDILRLCSVMLVRYHETVLCDVDQISLDCILWCWSDIMKLLCDIDQISQDCGVWWCSDIMILYFATLARYQKIVLSDFCEISRHWALRGWSDIMKLCSMIMVRYVTVMYDFGQIS
jgi:hypothetical protein